MCASVEAGDSSVITVGFGTEIMESISHILESGRTRF